MAKLYGKFDGTAVDVERLLNVGKKEEARQILLRELSQGTAGPILQKLAAKVFGAKRGRPATGLYRWIDIGKENSSMRAQGDSHEKRLLALSEKYGRGTDHIEKCTAQYDAAQEAAYDAERRDAD